MLYVLGNVFKDIVVPNCIVSQTKLCSIPITGEGEDILVYLFQDETSIWRMFVLGGEEDQEKIMVVNSGKGGKLLLTDHTFPESVEASLTARVSVGSFSGYGQVTNIDPFLNLSHTNIFRISPVCVHLNNVNTLKCADAWKFDEKAHRTLLGK